jgi:uncharacterized protein (UPF0261 family)
MDSVKTSVLLISTMDTTAQETRCLNECLPSQAVMPLIMDAGIRRRRPSGMAFTRDNGGRAAGRTIAAISTIDCEHGQQ